MSKTLIFISTTVVILLVWFLFDLSKYLPPDLIFHKAMKYEPESIQLELASILKRDNIPHRINSDGFIEYRSKDHEKIKTLAKQLVKSTSFNTIIDQPPPNTHFSDPEVQKQLIALMKAEKIPFQLVDLRKNGDKYLTWDQKDNDRVMELIVQVKQKIGCNKNSPNISFPFKKQTEYFTELLQREGIQFKEIQKNAKDYVEYNWADYANVQRLIKRTIAEVTVNPET